jgi:hypothetical protein
VSGVIGGSLDYRCKIQCREPWLGAAVNPPNA